MTLTTPTWANAICAKHLSYRTWLCPIFQVFGTCQHGEGCALAHGRHELRTPTQNAQAILRLAQWANVWQNTTATRNRPRDLPTLDDDGSFSKINQQVMTSSAFFPNAGKTSKMNVTGAGAAPPPPPPPNWIGPCKHFDDWKRLRGKHGMGQYMCQQCGERWKTSISYGPKSFCK